MSRLRALISMVVGFEGLRIFLLSSYQPKILGLFMIVCGFYFLRTSGRAGEEFRKHRSLLFPVLGFVVIAGDILYNLLSVGGLDLKGLDQMAILFGLTLIAYNLVSARYEREIRFIAIFFGVFMLVLNVPILMYSLVSAYFGADFEYTSTSWYVENFLTRPLVFMLKASGINVERSGGLWLNFAGKSEYMSVGIGIACSGAYSFAIFFSALTAYVLTGYRKVTGNHVVLLVFGAVMTYFANLLRMYVIIMVGYFYGKQALVDAHKNAGWLIFMAFVLIFWYFGFRVFVREEAD